MTDLHPHEQSRRRHAACAAAAALLAALPSPARALALLDEELVLEREERPVLLAAATRARPAKEGALDFDLLGAPPPAMRIDDAAMRLRRRMLDVHQGIGLGLVALELGTTIVGQLNYSDRFGSNPPATARYQSAHAALAYTTLGAFAVNGLVALLAPRPKGRTYAFDRVMVHRIGMALATAGMLSQGVLGVAAREREGRVDQQQVARTHLVIGYATAAAFGVAVGALVF